VRAIEADICALESDLRTSCPICKNTQKLTLTCMNMRIFVIFKRIKPLKTFLLSVIYFGYQNTQQTMMIILCHLETIQMNHSFRN